MIDNSRDSFLSFTEMSVSASVYLLWYTTNEGIINPIKNLTLIELDIVIYTRIKMGKNPTDQISDSEIV